MTWPGHDQLPAPDELTAFVSPMSQWVRVYEVWVWVKYILLCNSFVLSGIESIFGMKVVWDDRH